MNSPRVITSEQLVSAVQHETDLLQIANPQWLDVIAPNSVHVIDHRIVTASGVFCKALCCHIESDEAHEHQFWLTHEQFDSLPTADEFARQLERANEKE